MNYLSKGGLGLCQVPMWKWPSCSKYKLTCSIHFIIDSEFKYMQHFQYFIFKFSCAEYDKMSNFCASDASIENKRFICEKTCNLCSRNQYTDPLSSLELHDDHLPIQRRSAEQKCHDTKGIY